MNEQNRSLFSILLRSNKTQPQKHSGDRARTFLIIEEGSSMAKLPSSK